MRVVVLLLVLFFSHDIMAQQKYVVKDGDDFQDVYFKFISPHGSTRIAPTDNPNLISLIPDFDSDKLKVYKTEKTESDSKKVKYKVDAPNASPESDKINYSKLDRKAKNKWEVYLNKKKKLYLNFIFGFGNVDIDLSGLSTRALEIYSEKTNVNLTYLLGMPNQVAMKMLKIESRFGKVSINRAELMKTKLAYITLGSGDVELNFINKPKLTSRYKIKVDKGDVDLTLPDKKVPIKISIKDNPLCDVELPPEFTKRGDVYVNTSYYNNAPDALIFEIDLAWGDVKIEWAKKRN